MYCAACWYVAFAGNEDGTKSYRIGSNLCSVLKVVKKLQLVFGKPVGIVYH